MQSTSRKFYTAAINRVMDYVEQNITEPHSLDSLAKIARFSPFHFHRIFTWHTQETLNQFIRRVRIEKAASMLLTHTNITLSEVSDKVGFSSQSVFARTFKEVYGMSASAFKNGGFNQVSKICKIDSKNSQNKGSNSEYFSSIIINKQNLKTMGAKIEVKEMPAMQMVYVRHTGHYNLIGQSYEKLFKWAGPRGLLNFPETKTATIYHDDPTVTDIENVRQSACITVSEKVKTDGEIGEFTTTKGKYAVGRFEIGVMEFEVAWNTMCDWMADSGYQPGEGNSMELYHNNHEEHPEKKFILDICIPVKAI